MTPAIAIGDSVQQGPDSFFTFIPNLQARENDPRGGGRQGGSEAR